MVSAREQKLTTEIHEFRSAEGNLPVRLNSTLSTAAMPGKVAARKPSAEAVVFEFENVAGIVKGFGDLG